MLGRLKRIARLSPRTRERHPRLETLERRELLTVLTVKNTNDNGPDSLRAAIMTANTDNTVGGDTIQFAIGGSGTQTIALQTALPAILGKIQITGPTFVQGSIDGYGPPQIVIDGTNAGAGADGLTLLGPGGSTISGLAIVNFGSGTNGGGRGILVNDGGGDTFTQDYLGIDPDGTTPKGNVVGIELKSPNNMVGNSLSSSVLQVPNLISGNKGDGILIDGAGASNNLIQANRIGTDVSGEFSVSNLRGVTIASASNNTIGGTAAGAGNLISGNDVGPNFNTGIGINFTGTSSNNVVQGNLIGTDITGKKAVNNIYGIYFGTVGGSANTDSIANTTIGGPVAGAGNVISGNEIGISGFVTDSTIAGNKIGTDVSGTSAIGNGYGVYLGASGTTIGGTSAGAGNLVEFSGSIGTGGTGLDLTGVNDLVQGNFVVSNAVGISLHANDTTIGGVIPGSANIISGNSGSGIVLDSNGGNMIQGNVIGGGLGNGGNGISVDLAAPSGSATPTLPLPLNDTIGGLVAGGLNYITNNKGAGVAVSNSLGPYFGLSIRGNDISGNGELGISLGATTGVPTPGTLAITSATSTASTSTIYGVLGGTPGQTYLVDLYNNSVADASGFGEGANFLGTVPVAIGPGGIGAFSTTVNTPLGANPIVTATSTDNSNSTSEYSAAFPNSGTAFADLGITQTVSSPSVVNGGIVTLTFQITNNGPATANNVVFNDALPTNLINAEVTSPTGTNPPASGNVAQVPLGNLAPGASSTVTISAQTSVNGTVSNTAGVLGTTADPSYANNLTTQTFNVGPAVAPTADLAITINPSTSTPTVGSNLTYILTVTNNGTADATNVTVNDFLPTNGTLIAAVPSQGSAATVRGTLITDNLGTIASGASATIAVTVSPSQTSSASIVNSANVSGNQLDPIPGNNSATSTLGLAGTGAAALSLAQVFSPTVSVPGQADTITLTVRNTGTGAATGVVLVDNLPVGVTLQTAAASQGSRPTLQNNVVTSNLGTIAAGASATLVLSVVPTAQATGRVNLAGVVATGTSANTPVFSQAIFNVAAGPTVNSVSGSRSNAQLVVNFNGTITPASASNKANYRLYALGTTPRAVSASDRPIAFVTAVYSAQTGSVTLTPSRSIDPAQYYALVIVGNTSGGITDTSGRKLVGVAGGSSGTNYSTTFLAGKLPQA